MHEKAGFREIHEDLQSVDIRGNQILLKNVPKLVDKDGTKWVGIEDIVRAKSGFVANREGLNPKQIPILALLYAQVSHPIKIKGIKVSQGRIEQALRFHKMLFDIWQKSKAVGYETLFPQHAFGAGVCGPISKDLKIMTKSLEEKGLLEVKWSSRNGEPTIYNLTKDGFEVAERVWAEMPEEIQKIVSDTKYSLSLETAQNIMHYFHKRYPEYKKGYTKAEPEIDE